jgi:outer membrane protein assembly factor BamB
VARNRHRLALAIWILTPLVPCSITPRGLADDWPQWRGPNRDGVSREKGWTADWPREGPKLLWKTSVGTGFSSMAVSIGRLYTMGNTDNTDTVYCLDAETGAVVWKHSYPCSLVAVRHEGGPGATPTVEGGRVYTLSREGQVFCFEAATGKILWQTEVPEEAGSWRPFYGFTSSPLVLGDLVILNAGPTGLAFRKTTGEIVWRSGRKPSGYAAAVPFQAGTAVALFTPHELVAVRVDNGKALWRHPWATRWDLNIADPVVVGDKLLISSGYDRGSALLRLDGGEPKPVWENQELRSHFSTPVLFDGHLYGFDGNTHSLADCSLKCLDAGTGAVKWKATELQIGALIVADGKLIALDHRGELFVAPASPSAFQPLARAHVLGGKCWTAPVLANGRLYARNAQGNAVCLDVRGTQKSGE